MKDETLRKVLMLIASADEVEMRSISDATHTRYLSLRAQKRREVSRTIADGDRVVLRNIKPKYLEGTKATVVGKKTATKFIVELDPGCDPRAIQRFGARPICPAQILEKIDAES